MTLDPFAKVAAEASEIARRAKELEELAYRAMQLSRDLRDGKVVVLYLE